MRRGRLTGLFVSAVVAVLALAALGGSSVEARGVPEPIAPVALAPEDSCTTANGCGYPIYECFRLQQTSLGATKRAVSLETASFGLDGVEVRAPFLMCESALKFPVGEGSDVAPPEPEVYACYWTRLGQSIYQTETLVTDNFGLERVLVQRAEFMCERARKEHNGAAVGATTVGTGSPVWQCFLTTPVLKNRLFSVVTSNFGYHDILTYGSSIRCEDAVKYRDGHAPMGSATGQVQQCWAMTSAPHKWILDRIALTTENFGRFEALVLDSFMMCERATRLG